MQRRQFLSRTAATAGGLAGFAWPAAHAQDANALRWVVPYPAGGGTDVLARTLAEAMRVGLNQPIVVENKPGGATTIGAQDVARAAADGRTILQADNALMAFNEHLFKKLAVNPERDFSYIGGIGKFPLALVVHPSFPAQTLKEFIAYVKSRPGQVNYASPGNGSPHHLAMEMFKQRTKSFIVHIPYRGAAPAMQDVVAGQVPCMFLDLASGLTTMQGNRVRVLAFGGRQRTPLLPGVPTLIEEGIRDVEVFAFQGLLGPAGLPPAVVQRLNGELNKALANTTVLKRFLDFGMEPMPGTPDAFRSFARSEAARWGSIIRENGISLD
jgi:tripartite-type tricarboxylate transporter receptor subunit TctC